MDVLGSINLNGNELKNGRFEHLDDFPATPKVGTWSFIRKQLMLCVEMEELPVWVPLTPERNTYLHEQQVAANEWIISHKLDQESVMIQCFDGANNVMNPSEVQHVDSMTSKIVFPDAVLGKAIVMFGYTEGAHVDGKFKGGTGSLPVGSVIRYYRHQKLTEDLLPLMGQTVTREYFPDLVELFGEEGSDSLVLDDARGVFNRNLDFGKGKDADRVDGSIQAEMMLRHGHVGTAKSKDLGTKYSSYDGDHAHGTDWVTNLTAGSGPYPMAMKNHPSTRNYNTKTAGRHRHSLALGAHDHAVEVQETGGSENRPENIAYILVIKAKK